jgi:hypothetical protein
MIFIAILKAVQGRSVAAPFAQLTRPAWMDRMNRIKSHKTTKTAIATKSTNDTKGRDQELLNMHRLHEKDEDRKARENEGNRKTRENE